MKYIRFTEINAGGYGENATLVIKVKTNDAVNKTELEKIVDRLREEDSSRDTESIIADACEEYFGQTEYAMIHVIDVEF